MQLIWRQLVNIKELQVSDISSEMIKETKKRINELGLNQGKIKYKVCDLEKLKGLFDVVVCLDVFIHYPCLLYTSPSPRDGLLSRMPSSA